MYPFCLCKAALSLLTSIKRASLSTESNMPTCWVTYERTSSLNVKETDQSCHVSSARLCLWTGRFSWFGPHRIIICSANRKKKFLTWKQYCSFDDVISSLNFLDEYDERFFVTSKHCRTEWSNIWKKQEAFWRINYIWSYYMIVSLSSYEHFRQTSYG